MKSLGSLALIAALALAACSDTERGVGDAEVRVGTHVDLSGPLASWGVPVRNGLQMAFDEANAAGGVEGRMIRLYVEDNLYDPARAVAGVERLLSRDDVFAILAPLGTPTVHATLGRVMEARVLHLFPFTAARETYEPFDQLKFATSVPYADMMRLGTLYFLRNKQAKRVCTLVQDDDFGGAVREGVEAALRIEGLTLALAAVFPRGERNLSGQIASLKGAACDLLVVGGAVHETVAALEAAKTADLNVPMLGSQASYTPEVATLGADAAEGFFALGQIPVPYHDDADPKVRDWIRRYEAKFGVPADVQALAAYVTGRLFVAGLKAAGRDLTPESYAAALEAMPAWSDPDIGGAPFDFSATNHLGARGGFLARIENGRWVTQTPVAP